jgi:hypothetical protein
LLHAIIRCAHLPSARIYSSQHEFFICRTTLGYPWTTRGDALGVDTVRFVDPFSLKSSDNNVQPGCNRNWYYKLWFRPFHGSTHCSKSGGRHGWRRVCTRPWDGLLEKLTVSYFRMMTGDCDIYRTGLLVTDRPTAQCLVWPLQT